MRRKVEPVILRGDDEGKKVYNPDNPHFIPEDLHEVSRLKNTGKWIFEKVKKQVIR